MDQDHLTHQMPDRLSAGEIGSIARTVTSEAEARFLLDRIGVPRSRFPPWDEPSLYWNDVAFLLSSGTVRDGPRRLRQEMHERYPDNPDFDVFRMATSPRVDATEAAGGAGPSATSANGGGVGGWHIAAVLALIAAVTAPVWLPGRPGEIPGLAGVGATVAMLVCTIVPAPRWLAVCTIVAAVEAAGLAMIVGYALGLDAGVLRTALEALAAAVVSLVISAVSRWSAA